MAALEALTKPGRPGLMLALFLSFSVAAYIVWKITESPSQALQVTFNGLNVGAVYALLAMGFTLVYSTVWFFDLYYGAAAAMGAYGVFYLRSGESFGGQYDANNIVVNVLYALIVAGVVAWSLHTLYYERLRQRFSKRALQIANGFVAVVAGAYTGLVLTYPDNLSQALAPAIVLAAGSGAALALIWALKRTAAGRSRPLMLAGIGGAVGLSAGGIAAYLLFDVSESNLYLSWVVSCLLAGCVGLVLYRGLYIFMLARAKSTLIMLVGSLGVLLTISALIVIVFSGAPRALPAALGSEPIVIGGANIKGFAIFSIAAALVGFGFMWLLLQKTSLGKVIRAIGDDEQVAKVVGINTTAVIASVFFIGAVYAAFAGILTGQDIAIQPRMGLLLLLKGWISAVIGGMGNMTGAIVGGFVLGLIEQFGIWDIAGEWRDGVSLLMLIVFLAFWPKGMIPRK